MWNKERAFHAGSDTDIIAYGTESVSCKTDCRGGRSEPYNAVGKRGGKGEVKYLLKIYDTMETYLSDSYYIDWKNNNIIQKTKDLLIPVTMEILEKSTDALYMYQHLLPQEL